ncbi:MAG: halocarboxylic acid dehydrogenase DehI family protein, partial [Dehalococcoidia bacterium]
MNAPLVEEIRERLRSPYVPEAVARLAAAEGYLEAVWPRVASSVDTAGFLGSALYMADMALDAVEQVYDPVFSRDTLLDAGLAEGDLAALEGVVDVFHYVQPQVLLLLSALAEAMGREQVGGYGRPDPRPVTDRERAHLATPVPAAEADAGPLPEVTETLGLAAPSDLYRAVAAWPRYLDVSWEELQHLVAYPDFRRRGRGLYYYARSGAR